jgi:molybdopterin-guanine dinucleotide biosynthesis protein B
MRIIGFAGWSGAGKTTLLVRLIPALRARGLRISTLKHAHHAFDVDRPGKDSFAHRQAGATQVLVSSARRWALMHELRDDREPTLGELLARLSPVDIVLVEGFKRLGHAKIEVHRTANGKPFLHPGDPAIVAVVTDAPDALPLPSIGLDDIAAVADLVLAQARSLDETLAGIATGDR